MREVFQAGQHTRDQWRIVEPPAPPVRRLQSPGRARPSSLAPRGKRAVTWIGLVCLLTIIGLLGTTANRQSKEETDLARHRTLIQALSDTIRTMPRRALAAGSPVELRIDAKRGCFQLVTLVGKRKAATRIEDTMWLPEGLRVLEAPATITASASGQLSAASVVIVATMSNRLFRLTTRPPNLVQFDEEPMS